MQVIEGVDSDANTVTELELWSADVSHSCRLCKLDLASSQNARVTGRLIAESFPGQLCFQS